MKATLGAKVNLVLRRVVGLSIATLVLSLVLSKVVEAEPRIRVTGTPERGDMQAQLTERARRAYAHAEPMFRQGLSGTVTVRWVETGDEWVRQTGDGTGAIAAVARSDRQEILLSASAVLARPERLQTILVHEFCHLLFGRATRRAEVLPPRWLNEGIAMWRSGEWDLGLSWQSNHTTVLAEAAKAGAILPLSELESRFPGGRFFQVAYAQSLAFVEWLVRRGGEEGILDFLDALNQDLDLEPAFESVYGLSLDDAEEKWRGEVEGGAFSWLPSSGMLIGSMWTLLGLALIGKFIHTRIQLRRAEDELGDGW